MKNVLEKYDEEIDGKKEKFIRLGKLFVYFVLRLATEFLATKSCRDPGDFYTEGPPKKFQLFFFSKFSQIKIRKGPYFDVDY